MSNAALELNLINALGKLKHLAVNRDFIDSKKHMAPESIKEQFFAFTIGENNFLISANCFCAVFVDTPIAAVPNSPNMLAGLSNVRGVLTPVYQLHSLLGCNVVRKKIIFCIGKAEKSVGLLVDTLPASRAFSAQDSVPAEFYTNNKLISQLSERKFFVDKKLWHWLDGEALGEHFLALANAEQKK
jgi:chemotaxis signal transduction protein